MTEECFFPADVQVQETCVLLHFSNLLLPGRGALTRDRMSSVS